MKYTVALLALLATVACNQASSPPDTSGIGLAGSTDQPMSGPVEGPQPAPGAAHKMQRPSAATVPARSAASRSKAHRAPWELRAERIQSKLLDWQRLSPAEQARRLDLALREVMDRHKCNTVMGCPAREDLVAAGEQAAHAIVELYPKIHRDSYNRFHLLDILGEIPSEVTVPFLLPLLRSPQWNVRANAAFALGRLQAVEALPELRRHFLEVKEGSDAAFVYALAYALYRVGSNEGESALLTALRPERQAVVNWGYTRIAVEAVGLLGLTQACGDLAGSLAHKDLFLRRQALESVARLKCHQIPVLDAVAHLLEDVSPGVRAAAAETLLLVTGMPIKTLKSWNNYKSRKGGN